MTTDAQQQAVAVAEQSEAVLMSSNVEADGLRVGENLPDGLDDTDAEVTDIRYKDLVSAWNRETGGHSWALPYMVPAMAKQSVKAGLYKGEQQWAFKKSAVPDAVLNKPVAPKLPCYLNETHPDSAYYYSFGFRNCRAKGIPTRSALEMHMAKSHKRAWEMIQKDRDESRRDRTEANAQANTEALQALVAQLVNSQSPVEAPEPVVEVATAGQAAMQAPPPTDEARAAFEASDTEDKQYSATCPTCQEEISGRSQAGAFAALRGHEHREHPTTE